MSSNAYSAEPSEIGLPERSQSITAEGQNSKRQKMQFTDRLTLAWLTTLWKFLNLSNFPFFFFLFFIDV